MCGGTVIVSAVRPVRTWCEITVANKIDEIERVPNREARAEERRRQQADDSDDDEGDVDFDDWRSMNALK